MALEAEDVLAGGVEIKPNQVKFSKIGDVFIGYKVNEKLIEANGKPVKLYQLKGISGQYHWSEKKADENGNPTIIVDKEPTTVIAGEYYQMYGGKDVIDDCMRRAKQGQKVGVQYLKATPSKTSGNAPFKTFKAVLFDEMDKETLGEGQEDVIIE